MVIKRGEWRLKPRQMGVALEDIAEGEFGSALFEKEPGSGQYYEFEVKAIEYVREHHECWIVDSNNGITEHTPQELRSEDVNGIPYRVRDSAPLPVREYTSDPIIVHEAVVAAGDILEITPANDKYVALFGIDMVTDSDGNGVTLQVKDNAGTYRDVIAFLLSAYNPLPARYPFMRLKEFTSGGTKYTAKKGDGSTGTVKLVATGAGTWYATIYYLEVD